MKLSTKKIIAVAVGTLVLTSATLLIPNAVLREYLQVAVLALAIAAGVILLGWARPRGYQSKLVATLIILAAVVYQIVIFLLLGLKLGFVSNVYGISLVSFFQVVLPVILAIIGEEILRGQLVEKGKGSRLAVVCTGVAVWLVEVMISIPLYNLSVAQDLFIFIVVMAGLAMLKNTLLTYIAYQYDYRINLAYRLIMELPIYVLPLWPDSSEYLPAIFQIMFIFVLSLVLASQYRASVRMAMNGRNPKWIETEQTKRAKRVLRRAGVGVVALVVICYVALMSGLFRYHLLAIGSGSMSPNIERGDLVLVEKSRKYEEMNEGDVLVYRHSNVVMVHRIAEVKQDGANRVFITKGDANGAEDGWVVNQGDVIGVARGRIAMLGFPTLWLNELFNQQER